MSNLWNEVRHKSKPKSKALATAATTPTPKPKQKVTATSSGQYRGTGWTDSNRKLEVLHEARHMSEIRRVHFEKDRPRPVNHSQPHHPLLIPRDPQTEESFNESKWRRQAAEWVTFHGNEGIRILFTTINFRINDGFPVQPLTTLLRYLKIEHGTHLAPLLTPRGSLPY